MIYKLQNGGVVKLQNAWTTMPKAEDAILRSWEKQRQKEMLSTSMGKASGRYNTDLPLQTEYPEAVVFGGAKAIKTVPHILSVMMNPATASTTGGAIAATGLDASGLVAGLNDLDNYRRNWRNLKFSDVPGIMLSATTLLPGSSQLNNTKNISSLGKSLVRNLRTTNYPKTNTFNDGRIAPVWFGNVEYAHPIATHYEYPDDLTNFLATIRDRHHFDEQAKLAQRRFSAHWSNHAKQNPEQFREYQDVLETMRERSNANHKLISPQQEFNDIAKKKGYKITYDSFDNLATKIMNENWDDIFSEGFKVVNEDFKPGELRRLQELSKNLAERYPNINWNNYHSQTEISELLKDIKRANLLQDYHYNSQILPYTFSDMSWFAERRPYSFDWTPKNFFAKYAESVKNAAPSGSTNAVFNTSADAEPLRLRLAADNYGTMPGQYTITNLGNTSHNFGNNSSESAVIVTRTSPDEIQITRGDHIETVPFQMPTRENSTVVFPRKQIFDNVKRVQHNLLNKLNGKIKRLNRYVDSPIDYAYISKYDDDGKLRTDYSDFLQAIYKLKVEDESALYQPYLNRPQIVIHKWKQGGIIKGQNGFLNTWQKAYNSKFGKGLRNFMFGKDRDLTDEEYFEKYGYNKPVGGIGVLGALVAPEWEGLEIPEITAQHIGNQGKVLRWFESGNSKMSKVPIKETSKKASNWQKFLKLSQQEQDDFVRRWNGESFQGFATLKGDKQALGKFRSWINSRK